MQEGATRYRLRVVLGATTRDASEFIHAFGELLGPDADITVELVDDIPSEASGEYRAVIDRLND